LNQGVENGEEGGFGVEKLPKIPKMSRPLTFSRRCFIMALPVRETPTLNLEN
jgi:hypothetical protein